MIRKFERRMLTRHPLFRLMLVNGLAGAALGMLFVIGLVVFDVAGIRTLLAGTGEWVIGLSLLTMGSITTFASVAMGGAIMLIPKPSEPGEGGPKGGHGGRVGALQPLPVAVSASARGKARSGAPRAFWGN